MTTEDIAIRARTIAIVGAGPSGVIAAKYLRAEKAFDKIVLFEQRSGPGGIWTYTGDQRDENLFSIPQENPHQGQQNPDWRRKNHISNGVGITNGSNDPHDEPSFLSPMYEKLETNIPRGLMGFQDLDWPEDSQLFPKHETVLQYIKEYGRDVQDLVQYESQVLNVVPTGPSNTGWLVTSKNIRSKEQRTEEFDAVIVANGHFIVPYIPNMPQIKEWTKLHPGRISHSKYYRRPEEFEGKKVIVVGNSASGSDISNQIAPYCEQPLLWSTRSESLFSKSHGVADHRRQEVRPIARFLPESRGVQFEDGSISNDIDAIVFATGYFYNLPFLEDVEPKLITDGSHVNYTYQHLFYHPRPSLSFLALNQRVIPFPVAEVQAAVLARVYAGRLPLPSLSTMQAWESSVEAEMGNGRNFHLLPFPKDGNYINTMARWALSADTPNAAGNAAIGKAPPLWGDWEFWAREHFPKIRQAFGKLGDDRFRVREVKELGFDFEEFLREKNKGRDEEELVQNGETII